jgi:hypothetical protein
MPRKRKTKTEEATEREEATPSQSASLRGDKILPVKEPNPVGPYEDRRKEMQRKLQRLVLSMRAEKASDAVIKQAVNKEKRKEERKIIALEEKRANEEKAVANDVIIIPVAWRGVSHEKLSIDVTCDAVRQALYSTGLRPWLDCRREYTPGQKFAYWEHMGVRHRIEIGPDDVAKGVCRIVRADTAGAYLEHQRRTPKLNLKDIVATLAELGLEKCQSMNPELMNDTSLIPSAAPVEEVVTDEITGNAVIDEKEKRKDGSFGTYDKKFKRF